MFASALLCTAAIVAIAGSAPQAPADPQEIPAGVAAQWQGGQITIEEFEHFLGRSFRGKNLGREALSHLLQIQLVQHEAQARGLKVPAATVDERLEKARQEARKAEVDLDALLQARGLSQEEFRRLLRDSLLHEMLARQDLGRSPEAEVTAAELQAWTQNRIQELLEASASAPEGFALKSGPYAIPLQELGMTLRNFLGHTRLQEYLEQQVMELYLDQWAAQEGVEFNQQLIEEELAWRRQRSLEVGYPYEQLLQASGSSLEQVLKGSELRAAAYLRVLSRLRFDRQWFEELDQETRQQLEYRFGVARHCHWILLRAVAQKDERNPLDLTHEEAQAELRHYAEQIQSLEDFQRIAEQYSEHEESRRLKGVLGWLHRSEKRVDPSVTQAAYQAPIGEVFGPFPTTPGLLDGEALLWVSEERPQAEEAEFREIVRRGLHQELRRTILNEIQLRTIYRPAATQ
ncbi:MAG: hypothetical protein DWQ01_22460 [Planctomycetota bacterium]|nr:MAG: hypothetical protein DWQ01_22460 [Planctomycetota bacterium]